MKTRLALLITIITFAYTALAYDYPKSRVEREMDDMGSLLDGEGLVFRPKKEKSNATKAEIGNVNKYLFKAAIEVLSFAPLANADSNGGVVITDWYPLPEDKNTQFKVTVLIKDKIISTEGLEVIAFERKMHGGKWSEAEKKPSLSTALEDKILRKARDLYLAENKK